MQNKTILLLHGFPLDGSSWAPQQTALESAGYKVLCPDLPLSPPPAIAAASIESFAEQIHELIQQQPNRQAVVAGLSMGGYILFALLRAHPESVAAALFLDTKAAADTSEAQANRLKMIEEVQAHGTAALIETMLPKFLTPTAPEAVKQQLRAIIQRQSPQKISALQWAMAHRRDQTDLLPTLKIPTLFLAGMEDILTPPAQMRTMADRTPGAKFIEIPQAAHQSNLERPDEVNAALMDFLRTSIP